ncbi:MAG: CBS domain-containing protein [Rhodospirillales bacterium]|nr:CBS domain-containing protein [Rhodospirillales bacterium]
MFAIYDFEGLRFRDTLENLHKVRKVQESPKTLLSTETPEKTNDLHGNNQEVILKASQAYRKKIQLSDRVAITHAFQLMSHPVETIQSNQDVFSAWERFRGNQHHQLPVLDTQHQIVGILSERDLLKHLVTNADIPAYQNNNTVAEVMTNEVIVADPVTDVRRIARVMLDYRLSSVPIVNEKGELIGLVSRSDILRAAALDPPMNAHLSLWT